MEIFLANFFSKSPFSLYLPPMDIHTTRYALLDTLNTLRDANYTMNNVLCDLIISQYFNIIEIILPGQNSANSSQPTYTPTYLFYSEDHELIIGK